MHSDFEIIEILKTNDTTALANDRSIKNLRTMLKERRTCTKNEGNIKMIWKYNCRPLANSMPTKEVGTVDRIEGNHFEKHTWKKLVYDF